MSPEKPWIKRRTRIAQQERSTADAQRLRLAAVEIGHTALERPALRVVSPPMGELIHVDFTPLPEPPDIVA